MVFHETRISALNPYRSKVKSKQFSCTAQIRNSGDLSFLQPIDSRFDCPAHSLHPHTRDKASPHADSLPISRIQKPHLFLNGMGNYVQQERIPSVDATVSQLPVQLAIGLVSA